MQVIDSKLLDSNGQIKDAVLIAELNDFYHGDKFQLISAVSALLVFKSSNAELIS